MDPFEEFEFKPLTEGLGFHSRTQATEQPQSPRQGQNNFDLELMAPDMPRTQIQNTLPRNEARKEIKTEAPLELRRDRPFNPPPDTTSSRVDEILKTLGERRKLDFTANTAKVENREALWIATKIEISATLLDGMLIFAGYLACLIVLLMVTKADLFANLLSPDQQGMVFVGLIGLLASITWIYLVVNRMFLGCTPGEWVFDQRVGSPTQLGTAEYSLKIAARSFCVIASGIFVIPLLSMIMGRDLIGQALGIPLMKKA